MTRDAAEAPPPAVQGQIDAVALDPERPLIVTDADEVLFAFMDALKRHLEANGYYFDWSSYALNNNVRRREDDSPASMTELREILHTLFENCIAEMDPVPGAAEALAALARRAQVVVLSNVPQERHGDRRDALVRHGMDYPLVANGTGLKGPAVAALARRAGAPAFFIDDAPPHHSSVAAHANGVRRLHLVAHRRLAELVGRAPDCHHDVADWPAARAVIEAELAAAGR